MFCTLLQATLCRATRGRVCHFSGAIAACKKTVPCAVEMLQDPDKSSLMDLTYVSLAETKNPQISPMYALAIWCDPELALANNLAG